MKHREFDFVILCDGKLPVPLIPILSHVLGGPEESAQMCLKVLEHLFLPARQAKTHSRSNYDQINHFRRHSFPDLSSPSKREPLLHVPWILQVSQPMEYSGIHHPEFDAHSHL